MAVRLAILITALTAAVLSKTVGREVAIGLLGGGIAGALAFWVTALKCERVASEGPNAVRSTALRWNVFSLGLYLVVLTWAFTLDRDTLHGFFGAAAGLFVIRGVSLLLGLTGWDQKREN